MAVVAMRWTVIARNSGEVFGNSFSLRDDEQLLVKLSYRFDI